MLPLGGAKDEDFSFFQRSCQLGLRPVESCGGHVVVKCHHNGVEIITFFDFDTFEQIRTIFRNLPNYFKLSARAVARKLKN